MTSLAPTRSKNSFPAADSTPWCGAVASVAISTDTLDRKLVPYDLNEPFMAMSYHLHIVAEKISGMPEEMKYGTAAVLIASHGLAVLIGNGPIAVVLLGSQVWVLAWRLPSEEAQLAERFPDQWEAYRRRTWPILPRPGPRAGG